MAKHDLVVAEPRKQPIRRGLTRCQLMSFRQRFCVLLELADAQQLSPQGLLVGGISLSNPITVSFAQGRGAPHPGVNS